MPGKEILILGEAPTSDMRGYYYLDKTLGASLRGFYFYQN
jgi:hypothetical protein